MKKWCKANLSLSKNKDNEKTLQSVEKYCVKTLFTIKDKMKRKRRKLVEDLSQNLSTLKSSSADADLQKDLGSINSEIKDINAANEDVVKEALRIWCDNNIKTDLTKDKENELWKK
ncbi:hypothetical protein A6V39_00310 [Candidatus Mycoplasma haematobovis]|uniref:Uncharacterized protein n=1 Tax=Candidatus Mycoplasma haematobovis TaxID=432608 RepID=A0A1A9QD28_9MOLU|nr:hypothetical protein [Candidatus Mycoplasma haematobovis]OAL10492.1 hypothetical protein A6V39_00310 [Candidatus Mycoplasma haematobovis]